MTLTQSRFPGIAALAVGWGLCPAAYGQQAPEAAPMPASQQNAMVETYCVVCHNQGRMLGGLSLQEFDAAHPDPAVAGMMVNKLEGGAMGASGVEPPPWVVTKALIQALSESASNAAAATDGWALKSFNDPATAIPLVTAQIVRELPSAVNPGMFHGYELTLTCRKSSDMSRSGLEGGLADMQLATYAKEGLNGPRTARAITVAKDGSTMLRYEADGKAGVAMLHALEENAGILTAEMPLPTDTLIIRNLFADEAISFPFGGLTPTVRQVLVTCLSGAQ